MTIMCNNMAGYHGGISPSSWPPIVIIK